MRPSIRWRDLKLNRPAMCSRCWKNGPFKIVTNKSTSFRIPVCDNFLFIAEMMHISAENNKCILSPAKSTVSVSQWCFSPYRSTNGPLPHSSCLMMFPGSWSFTEGTCPLRVVLVTYSTWDAAVSGGGDVPKCSCECCHSNRCHRLLSVLQPDYRENLKISLHIQGAKQVHQQMNECKQCVRICVSQPLCV